MLATTKSLVARLLTNVIKVDAAQLVTLVTQATLHLLTLLLAPCIIGSRRQLLALHLVIHVTAPTLDDCLFVARRTLARMTFCRARMRLPRLTALERPFADPLARRDLVEARFSFAPHYGLFSARAAANSFR